MWRRKETTGASTSLPHYGHHVQTAWWTSRTTSSTAWSRHARTTTTSHLPRRCRPTTTLSVSSYYQQLLMEKETTQSQRKNYRTWYKPTRCGHHYVLLQRGLMRWRPTTSSWREKNYVVGRTLGEVTSNSQIGRLHSHAVYQHLHLFEPTSASPQLRNEFGFSCDVYNYGSCQWATSLGCCEHLPACGTTAQPTTCAPKARNQLQGAGEPLKLPTQHEWVCYTYGHHHRAQLQLHCADVDTTLLWVTLGWRHDHSWWPTRRCHITTIHDQQGVLQMTGLRSSSRRWGPTTCTYYRMRLRLQRRQLVELLHLLRRRKKGVRTTTISSDYDMEIVVKHVKRVLLLQHEEHYIGEWDNNLQAHYSGRVLLVAYYHWPDYSLRLEDATYTGVFPATWLLGNLLQRWLACHYNFPRVEGWAYYCHYVLCCREGVWKHWRQHCFRLPSHTASQNYWTAIISSRRKNMCVCVLETPIP